jgi:hypothetical protein
MHCGACPVVTCVKMKPQKTAINLSFILLMSYVYIFNPR